MSDVVRAPQDGIVANLTSALDNVVLKYELVVSNRGSRNDKCLRASVRNRLVALAPTFGEKAGSLVVELGFGQRNKGCVRCRGVSNLAIFEGNNRQAQQTVGLDVLAVYCKRNGAPVNVAPNAFAGNFGKIARSNNECSAAWACSNWAPA